MWGPVACHSFLRRNLLQLQMKCLFLWKITFHVSVQRRVLDKSWIFSFLYICKNDKCWLRSSQAASHSCDGKIEMLSGFQIMPLWWAGLICRSRGEGLWIKEFILNDTHPSFLASLQYETRPKWFFLQHIIGEAIFHNAQFYKFVEHFWKPISTSVLWWCCCVWWCRVLKKILPHSCCISKFQKELALECFLPLYIVYQSNQCNQHTHKSSSQPFFLSLFQGKTTQSCFSFLWFALVS